MQQHQTMNVKHHNNKYYKYDDWVCLLCQNYNYSFRSTCNRCHLQTRQQNNYMIKFYQQNQSSIYNPEEQPQNHVLQYFPNVVFFMINNDPWEQQPQRKDMQETINIKWINTLIEE